MSTQVALRRDVVAFDRPLGSARSTAFPASRDVLSALDLPFKRALRVTA